MKKILFFINTLGVGGAEHVLVDIVNQLDNKKFDITIRTIYDINVYKEDLNKNIKVESFYKPKKNKLIDKIYRKILYNMLIHCSKEKLYKMFIKEKYDIEVAFLEGLPTKIIAGSNNPKSNKIAWVHIDLKNNQESFLFYKTKENGKEIYKKFNNIYCVSEDSLKSFQEIFKITKNTYVVYNIINKDKILKLAKEKVKLKKCFNMLNVGRLTKQKGHDRLLKAYAASLPSLNKETHLYIAGDGDKLEELKQLILDLNLQDNVTLLGNQKNPYKYMKNSDLYVCSSYAEGYSLVIMESVFLRLPVLTTDCSGQKQILHNGDFGMIVSNEENALKEGIIYLVNNPNIIKKYKEKIEKDYEKYENSIKDIENMLLK